MTAPFDTVDSFLATRARMGLPLAGGASPASVLVRPNYAALAPAVAGYRQVLSSLPSGGGGLDTPGEFEDWLGEVARIAELTPSEAEAMRTISKFEGGFQNIPQRIHDINTEKGTPAFGPWQIIEPTFRGNVWGPEYGDWKNPIHSGLAVVNYARRRYGSLESVADRFRRQGHGGY